MSLYCSFWLNVKQHIRGHVCLHLPLELLFSLVDLEPICDFIVHLYPCFGASFGEVNVVSAVYVLSDVADHTHQLIVQESSQNCLVWKLLLACSVAFNWKAINVHNEHLALRWDGPGAVALSRFLAFLAFISLNGLLLNFQMQQFSMRYGMNILILNICCLLFAILALGSVLAINFED